MVRQQVFTLAKARARAVNRSITSKLPPTRLPSFLSQCEIDQVLTLKHKHQKLGLATSNPRNHWQTHYVSADGLLKLSCPAIYEKLKSLPSLVNKGLFSEEEEISSIPNNNNPEMCHQEQLHKECLQDIQVRCAEIHTAKKGGSLNDPGHFDSGSVVTVDVLLSGKFEGGMMTMSGEEIVFDVGDALIFPSYKYHTVEPITKGIRECLVVEFWNGEEKLCNHRCNIAHGDCRDFI